MMRAKQWVMRTAWRILYPSLRAWLNERALRLPASQKLTLSRRLHVSLEQIDAIEAAIRVAVLQTLDEWQP